MIALRATSRASRAGRWALCAALASATGLAWADLPVEELKGGTRLPPARKSPRRNSSRPAIDGMRSSAG
ncbi:hypothetical protein G6F57_023121 [Rhizopus arrhizus]|nr:hypothetical protein G6F57_023121 [Rhizopus arrhizus]